MRWHAIYGIFTRNVKQYFTSVLGYLFIVVFVTVCATLTFSPQFFADNLANLDQLTRYYPLLVLFFVPAITMGSWADERKLGTDAILFTLPASDWEILVGKFAAAVAVYTVALAFSLTQLVALSLIGDPDWGVIAATYFGYWLAGVALVAIGLFASSLTDSTTVAYLLGALLCAVPVLLGYLFEGNRTIEGLGMPSHLADFSTGQISLEGVVFFASIISLMLYLNMVAITRRHWSRGGEKLSTASRIGLAVIVGLIIGVASAIPALRDLSPLVGLALSLGIAVLATVTAYGLVNLRHFGIRIPALFVALIALNVIVNRGAGIIPTRLDLTSQGLYTLDDSTTDLLKTLRDSDAAVTIQAFVSPDVPRQFVNTRKYLAELLKQYDRRGGANVELRVVDVAPYSPQSQEARSLGIVPTSITETVGGKLVEQDVYLGAVVTSNAGETILPVIDSHSSLEYQLTRGLASATDRQRRVKVGVLKTDAHFDNLQYQGRDIPWGFSKSFEELKRSYDVESISAAQLAQLVGRPPSALDEPKSTPPPRPDPPDVMLVVDPSSLTQTALTDLVAYIQAGNPTLILADPLPFCWFTYRAPLNLGVVNAPAQPRIDFNAPWSPVATSPEPKPFGGRATTLLTALGLLWRHDAVVWHVFEPHVGFRPAIGDPEDEGWPEYYGPKEMMLTFVRPTADWPAFNPADAVSSGLQELLFIYPGSISPAPDSNIKFEPLVKLKAGNSGQLGWDEITQEIIAPQRSFNPQTGQPEVREAPLENFYTAQPLRLIRPSPIRRLDNVEHVIAARLRGGDPAINVIFIADSDFVADIFYDQREALGESLDNFTLLANAIESLAGDESLVRLRNRRPSANALVSLESQIEAIRRARAEEQAEAEQQVADKLAEARERLDKATEAIEQNQDMGAIQKAQEAGFAVQSEQRRFDIEKEKLDRQLAERIDQLRADERRSISMIENRTRALSVLLAPLPALILGIGVLIYRRAAEERHVAPARRLPTTPPRGQSVARN
jgi:ABC-2 type transport system permease protein